LGTPQWNLLRKNEAQEDVIVEQEELTLAEIAKKVLIQSMARMKEI
jgi:hypothetical protein